MQYFLKLIISAVLIVLISEIGKRSSFWGAILASLPFISILAFVFLYQETKDIQKINALSISIFWLVIPSLILFVSLPVFLKRGMNFYTALVLASALTVVGYFLMSFGMKRFGIAI